MNCMKQCLQMFSATVAIVSAGLWFYSAVVKVKSGKRVESDGMSSFALNDTATGSNVHETLKKQSFWNAWAAGVASIAAFTQGISMFLPD
ncbi:hypothetical protein [Pseudomonas marginalis]|uniref:hypothetical protein n=1 Tax=Pseudomonas marginalis TaxID=298 RepID=UPI0011B4DBDF|nr:hypothetical protein [Pseudomonas marginalis]KAA8555167.1 hypothetical protein FX984_01785 [Pseudomonas marginalis]TWR71917.1 hypothetical protein FIV40_09445 [Pseudomonas marginalis]